MTPRAVLRAARRMSRVLAERQIPHALAGGLAVGLHGFNRWTSNADLVVSKSARKAIEQLGPTTPIRGHLNGISVRVDRVIVAFLFLRKPLRRADLMSAVEVAGVSVIGINALIAMKVAAGRIKDVIDVVELLKVGKVSVEEVSERLAGKGLEQFRDLVKIADLEKKGNTKESRRISLAVLARSAGIDLKSLKLRAAT